MQFGHLKPGKCFLTKYNKIKQKLPSQSDKTNTQKEKSPRESPTIRLIHSHTWEPHANTKLEAKINGEDLVQTQAGPALAASVSVNFNPVDVKGLDFLVSSISSGPYTLSAFSSTGCPEPWGKGFDGDIPDRTECCKSHMPCVTCSSESLYLICLIYTSDAAAH